MRTSIKPILALLATILAVYLAGSLTIYLRRQAGATFQFNPYLLGSLVLTLLAGSGLVLLVAYLWSRPAEHRVAAWVFLGAGVLLLIYPFLRLAGFLGAVLPGPFLYSWMEIFFPGSIGSLCAATIAASGLFHLAHNRNGKLLHAEA